MPSSILTTQQSGSPSGAVRCIPNCAYSTATTSTSMTGRRARAASNTYTVNDRATPAWKEFSCGVCVDSSCYSASLGCCYEGCLPCSCSSCSGNVQWMAIEINSGHARQIPNMSTERLPANLVKVIITEEDRTLQGELHIPNLDLCKSTCDFGCRELTAFQLCIYKNKLKMAKSFVDVVLKGKDVKKFIEDQFTTAITDGCDLYNGETILHVATLHAAAADRTANTTLEYLVKDLLMGIVYHEKTEVNKSMVEKVLNAEATGDFFTRRAMTESEVTRQNYLNAGRTAVQMAVCLMSVNVVKFLMDNSRTCGFKLNLYDSDAKTKKTSNVFHQLAMQKPRVDSTNKKEMDFFLGCHAKRLKKMFELLKVENPDLLDERNEDGYQPIHTAAYHGNIEAFKLFLSAPNVKVAELDYGVSTLTAYKLAELDSNATTNTQAINVLDIVVSSPVPESREILDLPCFRQLITLKWQRYGSVGFTVMLFLNILFVSLLSAVIVFRPLTCAESGNHPVPAAAAAAMPDRDSSTMSDTDTERCHPLATTPVKDAYKTTDDFIRLTGEVGLILLAILHTVSEIGDIIRIRNRSPDPSKQGSYCWKRFRNGSIGRSMLFTIIKWTSLLLVFVAAILRVTDSPHQDVVLAFAAFAAYVYTFIFARNFEFTGPYIISIYKICTTVITKFAFVYGFTVMTFGIFFLTLFQEATPEPPDNFSGYFRVLFNVFRSTLGLTDLEYEAILTAKQAWLVALFFVFFLVFSVLLLVNFLVALMNGKQGSMLEESKLIWRMQVVASLLMTERRMPNNRFGRFLGYHPKPVGLTGKELFTLLPDSEDKEDTRYICVHERRRTLFGKRRSTK